MKFLITAKQGNHLLSLIKDKPIVGSVSATLLPFTPEIIGYKFPFTPSQFEANDQFHQILFDTFTKHVYDSPVQQALAKHLHSGYLNINDQRTPLNWGRTADAEDIIGTVLVQEGKMVPKTFEAMPTHRIYSSSGFFQLEPFLFEKLLHELNTH